MSYPRELSPAEAREPSVLAAVHPGEILQTEFLEPLGVSQREAARRMHVPANRINAIVRGERAITADTAIRLARLFGTSPELWINLQKDYELRVARQEIPAEEYDAVEPL